MVMKNIFFITFDIDSISVIIIISVVRKLAERLISEVITSDKTRILQTKIMTSSFPLT